MEEHPVPDRREIYEVTVTRPEGVSVAEMKEYIRDAVHSWGSQFRPDSPLFYKHRPVKVRRPKLKI